MKLLIHEIRPENPAEYNHDYMSQAQLIERDGIKSLFRIPGIMPRYGGMSADDMKNASKGGAKTESNFHPGVGTKSEQASKSKVPATESYSPISDGYENLESAQGQHQQLWYLFKFSHFMRLWMPFDTYCKFTMSLGIVSLGHGTTYFVVSKVGLSKLSYFFSLVCMVSPFLYFPMVVVADNFQFPNRKTFLAGMALQLAGPIFGVIAVYARGRERHGLIENICAPLCFLFHALFYAAVFTVSYSKADDGRLPGIDRDDDLLGDVIQDLTQAMDEMTAQVNGSIGKAGVAVENGDNHPSEQVEQEAGWESDTKYKDAAEPELPGKSASQKSMAAGFQGISQTGWPTDSKEFHQQAKALNKRVKTSLRHALMVAVAMYIVLTTRCCFKIADKRVWSINVDEPVPFAVLAKEWPVIWSTAPFFMPTCMACSGHAIFLSDRYHVFELENGQNLRQLCKFNKPIVNIINFCEETGHCRPLVLLHKDAKKKVVEFQECVEGNHTSELMQSLGEINQASTYRRRENGVTTRLLVTTHRTELLQSRLSKEGNRWDPDWTLGTFGPNPLRSISASADFLMLFSMHEIEARSSTSQSVVGKWELPEDVGELHAGCRIAGTAKALTIAERGDDDQPRMIELQLPGLDNAVHAQQAKIQPHGHSLLGRHQQYRASAGVLGVDEETQDAYSSSTSGYKQMRGHE
jgi:hypothetical protein